MENGEHYTLLGEELTNVDIFDLAASRIPVDKDCKKRMTSDELEDRQLSLPYIMKRSTDAYVSFLQRRANETSVDALCEAKIGRMNLMTKQIATQEIQYRQPGAKATGSKMELCTELARLRKRDFEANDNQTYVTVDDDGKVSFVSSLDEISLPPAPASANSARLRDMILGSPGQLPQPPEPQAVPPNHVDGVDDASCGDRKRRSSLGSGASEPRSATKRRTAAYYCELQDGPG